MISWILSIASVLAFIYISYVWIKVNLDRRKRLEELRIVYTIGLKEYNKSICRHSNQSKPQIIS